jgi:hypothetical protein
VVFFIIIFVIAVTIGVVLGLIPVYSNKENGKFDENSLFQNSLRF